MEPKHSGFEVEEDLPFQRKTWIVERAGWALMALIALASLILIDVILSLVCQRWKAVDKWFEGVPMTLVDNGKLLEDRLSMARLEKCDVMEAARRLRGLENLSQIKYAVLEKSGDITIIPYTEADGPKVQPVVPPS